MGDFSLFSMLNASNWLFQAGSVYCSSVFGVFLVSSCYKRGVFFCSQNICLLPRLTETIKTLTSRFYPHSTSVGVRKKILVFFKVEMAHSIGNNVCPRPLRKSRIKVFPIFPNRETIVSYKTNVEMYKDL